MPFINTKNLRGPIVLIKHHLPSNTHADNTIMPFTSSPITFNFKDTAV